MKRLDYYNMFGWGKSPFIKSTSLDIPILERKREYTEVTECVGGWDRIMVITAPIGYGKTTFMNQLIKKPPGVRYLVSFDAYEPVEAVMQRVLGVLPFWKKLFMKVDRMSFGDFLQKKLRDKRMLLIFDEAQEYDEELFKWLRMLNDRADNVFMMFIGLGNLEDKIASETSFRDRKARSIKLSPFSVDELFEITRKRIGWAGGKDIKPFTEEGLRRLCESANAVPRLLMERGQRIIKECAEKDILEIDVEVVEEILGGDETFTGQIVIEEPVKSENVAHGRDFMEELSPTQREIITLFIDKESLSITEVCEYLNRDIRSVGSLIRKLRGLNKDEIARKPGVPYPLIVRKGKEKRLGRVQYVYSLSDNVRRLLAEK